MTVKELIEELQKYPEDLKVWVSDNGYCEGATPFKGCKIENAHSASLDRDSVDDEYHYLDEESDFAEQVKKYEEKGYKFIEHPNFPVMSKEILMIYGE